MSTPCIVPSAWLQPDGQLDGSEHCVQQQKKQLYDLVAGDLRKIARKPKAC